MMLARLRGFRVKARLCGGACLALVCLGIYGCGRAGLREDREVEQILYEIYLAESATMQRDSLQRLMRDSALEIYSITLQRHGYSVSQFDSILSMYSSEPKRLDMILDRLIARMQEEREALAVVDTSQLDLAVE